VACLLLAHLFGVAQAQDAGWYGPYDDNCYHWWDGYQWTDDVDCNADGYNDSAGYAAGWYGPFDNGCWYWWDGARYSGEYDCNGDGYTDATEETYQPGWYDLYGNGCRYWFDGTTYTGDVDCNGDGATDTSRQPDDIDTASADRFIESQVAAINQMWADRFGAQGLAYTETRVVLASKPITIGCTTKDGDLLLETEDWIFYCSGDQTVYFGPENLDRVVVSGIGAVQFMVAHEIGHHVQDEIDPDFSTNYARDTVAYENQATCMAGIWFYELDRLGTPSDINAAMTFLSTATDGVHGKAEDPVAALLKGYHDPNAC
jgi:Putative neutral zinc metallopeptidase